MTGEKVVVEVPQGFYGVLGLLNLGVLSIFILKGGECFLISGEYGEVIKCMVQ